MTSYTAITNAEIDADSPVTQPLMTAMRDNPIAISEGSTNAPVNQTQWHPYDMVLVGDGNDGKFYDFAVDGASSAIETPAFADGYEYAIRFLNFSISATNTVSVEIYSATDGTWVTLDSASLNATYSCVGFIEIRLPRVAANGWGGFWAVSLSDTTGGAVMSGATTADAVGSTRSKVSKARVAIAGGGAADAGSLYLYRRREFVSG